ncbi:endonuclease/exonuclease/phosphatase family protein [Streptomyces sp. NA02950]|uniref:endonuclease/exonuclease/phosphatase family protein n=1 Tax=Streptomyces sp. NA02950 TaxID=2742137 RepID=UPI0015915930|nr:endonuclease/exonuclease/phosphatase family protein [Streptomyces sp. NA02950]QKV96459.1 endonuclease/exonuclease/phosphatase family protein [Streptomyces sp. NA02950]
MAMRTHLALALGALLLGAGAAAGPPAAATEPAAPVAADETIGQFNMAGGNDEHGPKGDEVPDALVRSVEDRRPAFMTLEESCRDWTDRLRSRLPGYTVVFHAVTAGDGKPAQCKHPSDFGNAVLFRNDLGFDANTAVAHPLESPAGYEQREMLCVRSEARKTAVCGTHLTVGSDGPHLRARRHEASVAARILATDYAGYHRFLGGDLNDDPLSGATDNFYHPGYARGAHGEFKEADSPCGNEIKRGYWIWSIPPRWVSCRSGESTHSQGKIDYLFTPPSVRVSWADATHASHSDHDPLWAGVALPS